MKNSLKVLAVGNSFSEDAMHYLYDIAKSGGLEKIVLGNLFIGGCSLNTHINNAKTGKEDYLYFKNSTGEWLAYENRSLLYGLLDEDWDIITLQQYSGHSGVIDTYNQDFDDLIDFINKHKTNHKAQLAWHMTWAYEKTSDHTDFSLYRNDQLNMYNSIVNAVKAKIAKNRAFKFVIPTGTAIQNLRASFIGDNLTRDGYHLNDVGRFAAALTWFGILTGVDLKSAGFVPNGITQDRLEAIRNAVDSALSNPWY